MRKSHLLLTTASIVLLSACDSGNKSAVNADLLKDLELASSADGINLGNGAVTSSQQFVSTIERTSPPARTVAKSAPVKRYKPARKSPPQVVKTQAPADVSESEPSEVRMVFTPIESDAPITPRPQPVAVSYPTSASSGGGNGAATGAVLGTIFGVVLRGGSAGDDHCDPRRDRRRGTRISINNRIPAGGGSGLGRVAIGRRGTPGDITSRFPH
ncbi:MAG: hypothetical protein M3365_09695 [Gemmatimonadota bacterium]|nr:hypothetical protein [Gemmatimonadota bacterium]